MEHMLLTPRSITLGRDGIPYRIIHHLAEGNRHYDANLKKGYGQDDDLRRIHQLEEEVSPLTDDQKDRRVAADFCCIWRYDFPERVHAICSIIGGSDHTALRLHYQISSERRKELIDYATALKGWLSDVSPDDRSFFGSCASEVVSKVYGFLGTKDSSLKEKLVERTYIGLSRRALNCSFWGRNMTSEKTPLYPYTAQDLPDDWDGRMHRLENEIMKELGRGAQEFLCEVGGAAEPACHFKFIRRVDILVSSIGCLAWRGNVPPKDSSLKNRDAVTQSYLQVLERYWKEDSTAPATAQQQAIQQRIRGELGEPDTFKRWLTACLWKNISNQHTYHAYPMKRWVDFVKIAEDYLHSM